MNDYSERVWLYRLRLHYGDAKTLNDRIGFVPATVCDERGVAWISVKSLRARLVAIWPELLEGPKRGRRASGISHDHLKRALAAHPDWKSLGQVRYPDKRHGPSIRVLSDAARREIGHPVPFAEAAKWPPVMAPGEPAWLSHFPKPKWHDTSNPKTKSQRNRPEKRGTSVIPAEPDIARELEELPGWLPLHSLEWEI